MARCPQCQFLTRRRAGRPCAVCASGVAVARVLDIRPTAIPEPWAKPATWDRPRILAAVQTWCRAHPMARLTLADCHPRYALPRETTIRKYWPSLRALEDEARAGLRQEGVAV